MTGKITWYNDKQGFGFITGSDGDRLYFHAPQREMFSIDDMVTYDIETNPDTRLSFAVNVKPEK